MLPSFLRQIFRILNKFFMVPIFRLGIGTFFGNPFWGYMMVLKTIGRKSGKIRYSPVNYAIMNGNIYCLAGWGQIADWYRNLVSHPNVEMILPGRALAGVAEEVTLSTERIMALRKVLKAGGFAGFLMGVNPYTTSDDRLAEKTKGIPLIRIRVSGIGSGPSDPGGWLWIPVVIIMVIYGCQRSPAIPGTSRSSAKFALAKKQPGYFEYKPGEDRLVRNATAAEEPVQPHRHLQSAE